MRVAATDSVYRFGVTHSLTCDLVAFCTVQTVMNSKTATLAVDMMSFSAFSDNFHPFGSRDDLGV